MSRRKLREKRIESLPIRAQVIDYFGGVSKLAELLGVSRIAVWKWGKHLPIPELRAIQINYLSEGKFDVDELLDEWE